MNIKELYIDMDGVLCNFHKRFDELFKSSPLVDYPTSNINNSKKFKQQFNEFVVGNNFATLEPVPDFNLAVRFINNIPKRIRLYILSSTANEDYYPEISKQKNEWLKKYDIRIPAIYVPGKRFKQTYSGAGKILIDDTKQNIDQWNDRSGKAIFHKNWRTTIKEYNNLLNN